MTDVQRSMGPSVCGFPTGRLAALIACGLALGCVAERDDPDAVGDHGPIVLPATGDEGDASPTASTGGFGFDSDLDQPDPSPETGSEGVVTEGGVEEICDGVDNDQNGVIDDVDVGDDGVCDCLRVATLGVPGQWGEGDVFAQWLDSRSTDGARALEDAVLTPELLSEYQVIVVQDVSVIDRAYGADEVEALRAWVENGGGLLTLIGYADPTELANVNALLEPFGVGYDEEQILQRSGGATIPVTEYEDHPITQGISAVGVDNGYPVAGEGLVYAAEGGHDVGRAVEVGAGRVSVWGDEWITYDSEWVDHPEYQVERFWLNQIKWLTPATMCQVDIPPTIP